MSTDKCVCHYGEAAWKRCKVHKDPVSTDLQDKIMEHVEGWVLKNEVMPSSSEIQFLAKEIEQLVTEARLGELEWVKSVSAKWGIPSYEIMAKTMEERIKTLQERKSQ